MRFLRVIDLAPQVHVANQSNFVTKNRNVNENDVNSSPNRVRSSLNATSTGNANQSQNLGATTENVNPTLNIDVNLNGVPSRLLTRNTHQDNLRVPENSGSPVNRSANFVCSN